jgi:hypothetical protein
MDQARARKHDEDLSNPAREQVIDLAEAGGVGIATADRNPGAYDEGSWSRVDAWAGQFGHYGSIRGARGRVMARRAAGYDVVAAGGAGGDMDEQA